MPSQKTSLLSPSELAYLHTSLSLCPPIRPDARSPTTFRPLVAESDLLSSANGSARLCFADGMEGVVGVKAEMERCSMNTRAGEIPANEAIDMGRVDAAALETNAADAPTEHGWVEVTIDMPGQRDDDSVVVFLAQMIQEGLVADGTLLQRLFINQKWHWKLYIDILLLSPPASFPLPLLSLSTHLALLSTRVPKSLSQGEEDPMFNDDWDAALFLYPISNGKEHGNAASLKPPVTLLVVSAGSNIFFDPSREELAVADAVIAVTITSTFASGIEVLGVRTMDSPARLSISSSAALGGEAGFSLSGSEEEGIWKPTRGGMKRALLGEMLNLCVKPGGVGQEVLSGLEAFG